MPARPAYFHRLTEAIHVFRQLRVDWIDRRTLQETLGISKTVAWRLLRQCGATQGPGNTLVYGRLDLIRALEQIEQTGACEQEIRRRGRVEARLAELLSAARSRHIRIAPGERALDLVNTRFGQLPPGIDLTSGRLTIEFAGTEEFLQKVGAVVFALQNDFELIRAFIEGP